MTTPTTTAQNEAQIADLIRIRATLMNGDGNLTTDDFDTLTAMGWSNGADDLADQIDEIISARQLRRIELQAQRTTVQVEAEIDELRDIAERYNRDGGTLKSNADHERMFELGGTPGGDPNEECQRLIAERLTECRALNDRIDAIQKEIDELGDIGRDIRSSNVRMIAPPLGNLERLIALGAQPQAVALDEVDRLVAFRRGVIRELTGTPADARDFDAIETEVDRLKSLIRALDNASPGVTKFRMTPDLMKQFPDVQPVTDAADLFRAIARRRDEQNRIKAGNPGPAQRPVGDILVGRLGSKLMDVGGALGARDRAIEQGNALVDRAAAALRSNVVRDVFSHFGALPGDTVVVHYFDDGDVQKEAGTYAGIGVHPRRVVWADAPDGFTDIVPELLMIGGTATTVDPFVTQIDVAMIEGIEVIHATAIRSFTE